MPANNIVEGSGTDATTKRAWSGPPVLPKLKVTVRRSSLSVMLSLPLTPTIPPARISS